MLIGTTHKCKKQERGLEGFAGDHSEGVFLLNNLSLWRAMQVLPVTFMKQSESNKKHLGNMSLDLVFSHDLFHF